MKWRQFKTAQKWAASLLQGAGFESLPLGEQGLSSVQWAELEGARKAVQAAAKAVKAARKAKPAPQRKVRAARAVRPRANEAVAEARERLFAARRSLLEKARRVATTAAWIGRKGETTLALFPNIRPTGWVEGIVAVATRPSPLGKVQSSVLLPVGGNPREAGFEDLLLGLGQSLRRSYVAAVEAAHARDKAEEARKAKALKKAAEERLALLRAEAEAEARRVEREGNKAWRKLVAGFRREQRAQERAKREVKKASLLERVF